MKNQGSCGCCWSFAATAAYESLLKLNGFSYDLSAEAALECTSAYAPGKRKSDCSGGYFVDPLTFLAQVGSVLDSTYPYVAGNYGSSAGYPSTPGICTERNRIFLGAGTAQIISSASITALQIKTALVTYGPMMVGIYANNAFSFYSSGIFSGCSADAASYINHAVLLYGWDANGNWLIKNQWGASWGNGGYMVLSKTTDCGISALLGYVDVPVKNANVQVNMDPKYSWEQFVTVGLTLFILLGILG